ncbi:transcriptional regulator [Streptococcus loxodontisalivarius]|uniref:Transcriptional regulator n=1 Tax=Streptococcus loxodontisalivarius TaxID=1349415 RepID=A0ABS2PPY2_9STRE|nr:transcriptional regulator [Streptococcus loxodontisalivarius]MBM7642035.1 hypothetical protein [Streptococcus loxodontisalivarius]HEO6695218.1 transcriptional regulator [Streptococcus agalactiae]
MGERFWDNLTLILIEKEMTLVALCRRLFQGQYVYPSEFKRLYQTVRHYKSEKRIPQSQWVEQIVCILDLDYEDLFRRL